MNGRWTAKNQTSTGTYAEACSLACPYLRPLAVINDSFGWGDLFHFQCEGTGALDHD